MKFRPMRTWMPSPKPSSHNAWLYLLTHRLDDDPAALAARVFKPVRRSNVDRPVTG
jgi:hypothetical protein